MPLLIAGVISVMLVSSVIVLGHWIITKNSAYAWIMAYLAVLSLSIFKGLSLLSNLNRYLHNPMGSEYISLDLGITAVLWAVSMGLLMIGVYKLGR